MWQTAYILMEKNLNYIKSNFPQTIVDGCSLKVSLYYIDTYSIYSTFSITEFPSTDQQIIQVIQTPGNCVHKSGNHLSKAQVRWELYFDFFFQAVF